VSRVTLVTGGGTGIGAACCRALAAAGFRVAVHHRASAATAQRLAAELPPGAFTLRADLAEPAAVVLRRFMLRAGGGRIVNVTSVVGHLPRDQRELRERERGAREWRALRWLS
jgi:NAD(P)-dependent dehydrogenase (short-subunit alcohol dehydrogenase family)